MRHSIPTQPSRYKSDVGHFRSNAILRIAGANRDGGPGGWQVGGWTAEGEDRIVHGGPKVQGPHAYAFGLCGVIASDPSMSTGAEHERADAEGRLFDVAAGDELEIEGTVYVLSVDGRGYPSLEIAS